VQFEVLHKSTKSGARVGRIHTPHGVIDTPGFVAVGTNGTIKSLDSQMVAEIGLQLMFCNTYHLLLEPGPDVVEKAGGLHAFMNRKMPIITDSGGFQVFSLAYGSITSEIKSAGKKSQNSSVVKISEEGVTFRSYRDGKKIVLTPESSVEAQKALGADIIIPFDELPPYHISSKKLRASLERTHRWEKRSLDAHLKNPRGQAMYGVIHGGIDPELRKKSCQTLSKLAFDGYAIGGSVGKSKSEMLEMLGHMMGHLPQEKPIHLLGIGDLASLENCIPLGIDTFDSSYPTKAARHGLLFTKTGGIKLGKKIRALDFGPIERDCECHTCQNYSLAYLSHLFRAKELTALTLASIHNLHYVVRYMEETRKKIFENVI